MIQRLSGIGRLRPVVQPPQRHLVMAASSTRGPIASSIVRKVEQQLKPLVVEVVNESHKVRGIFTDLGGFLGGLRHHQGMLPTLFRAKSRRGARQNCASSRLLFPTLQHAGHAGVAEAAGSAAGASQETHLR